MTLKEKLNDNIITNINIVESENRMCYNYNHLELAESCEIIADDFAIEFAKWTHNLRNACEKDNAECNKWKNISNKELLEIYKKEYIYEDKSNKAV
jgi:hypothetical protein